MGNQGCCTSAVHKVSKGDIKRAMTSAGSSSATPKSSRIQVSTMDEIEELANSNGDAFSGRSVAATSSKLLAMSLDANN